MTGRLRTLALGISVDEASFAKRGFSCSSARTRNRLEQAGRHFIEGYRAALADGRPGLISTSLASIPLEFRGFAFEGAAMAFTLLDGLTPWRRNRIHEFIQDAGEPHIYMAHVGAGWALARLPHLRWRCDSFLAGF